MKICRFTDGDEIRIGLIKDEATLLDLTPAGITRLQPLLENPDSAAKINSENLAQIPLSAATLCAPVERQEVWAAGVTYLRSKTARMEESDFSANAYDKVYAAERPEIFFKSIAEKVVAHGEPAGIRRDARWNVPEPELALVLNSHGKIAGYTIGNDMSSRGHRRRKSFVPAAGQNLRALVRPGPLDRNGPVRERRRGAGLFILTSSGRDKAFLPARPPLARSSAVSRNWPGTFSAARNFRMGRYY